MIKWKLKTSVAHSNLNSRGRKASLVVLTDVEKLEKTRKRSKSLSLQV